MLHVSLRRVSLRMNQGASFEQALMDTASDGFGGDVAVIPTMLRAATCLLADGLDETDPNRATIAGYLRNWALADETRRVVLTTRPIGHNPAWFPDWEHFELLPLDTHDVDGLAHNIFAQLPANRSQQNRPTVKRFAELINKSNAARLASRNPLLLGFLIALYLNDYNLGSNRYQLFAHILDIIYGQSRADREYQHQMNETEARRAIDCLGWLLTNQPTLATTEVVRELGQLLAASFALNTWQAEQRAQAALSFWEERGLLERVGAGARQTYTFVYMTFQEFTAARYLASLQDEVFSNWVQRHYIHPRYRETLLLIGGTNKSALAVEILLDADIAEDPVSSAALVATEVIAEMEKPPGRLVERVIEHISRRLTSQVPVVVYEAADKLIALAPAASALLGPLTRELAKHEHYWTREVACALGLLTGKDYIVEEALVSVYPNASDTSDIGMHSGHRYGILLNNKSILRELLLRGADHFLQVNAPLEHIEIIKQKYINANHSSGVHSQIEAKLCKVVGEAVVEDLRNQQTEARIERSALHLTKLGFGDIQTNREIFRKQEVPRDQSVIDQAIRDSDKALLLAIVQASDHIMEMTGSFRSASDMGTLGSIWQILDVGSTALQEIYQLRQKPLEAELIEVLRGVLLVAALDPAQVQMEAQQVLKKLDTAHFSVYRAIDETAEFLGGRDVDWSLVAKGQLDPQILFRALAHPSYFVCRFAAHLLVNCFDNSVVRRWFTDALDNGPRAGLFILGQIAEDIWGKEAMELFSAQLECNITPESTPLVKGLGRICNVAFAERTITILRDALLSTHVELVKAGLYAMQELALDAPLKETVRERYVWWLYDGPSDSDGNIADILLAYMITQGSVTEVDLVAAANAKSSNVREVAFKELCQRMAVDEELATRIFEDTFSHKLPAELLDTLSQSQPSVSKGCFEHINNTALIEFVNFKHFNICNALIMELCQRMAADDDLVLRIFDDLFNHKLPLELLNTLSQSQPDVCKTHFDHIAALLESADRRTQQAAIQALGDGWADYSLAEAKLHPLFHSPDVSLRNEAVESLRRLQAQKKE